MKDVSKQLAEWLDAKSIYDAVNELRAFGGDAVIITDGSGTEWKRACGWAAFLFEQETSRFRLMQGAMNCGSSYLAELMPYIQSLSWYVDGYGKARLKEKLGKDLRAKFVVHSITDNQTLAKQGQMEKARSTGDYYWCMIDRIVERGFDLVWHWHPRERLALNKLMDCLAGLNRRGMDALDVTTIPTTETMLELPHVRP